MQSQIPDWLARRVLSEAAKIAVTFGSDTLESLTWAELYRRAAGIAAFLASQNIGPGTRVAVLSANTRPFVELFHGLIQLKAVLVPLNTRLTNAELAWQIQDVGAAMLIYDERNAAKAAALHQEQPELPMLTTAELASSNPAANFKLREWLELDELHTIVYSSGTTGRPKGVRLTYGNHFWSAIASSLNLGNSLDDKWLIILPLFHVGGMSILFRSLIYGVQAIVHESFDAAAVNRAIDEQGVTLVSVVAVMLQRMLDERGDKAYPPHLRGLLLGGGPAPLPLLQRCERAAVPVAQTYGMTETASQFATLAPEQALRKLGSAGLPLLPNVLRLENEGQSVPAGEVGEIVLRGPSVSSGYDHRPAETARAFRDGWFYTGDLGRLDDEGYLYVVDRRDDLIISGGENIYPAEIEAVLLGHPAIEEAGVFGLPDEKWGAVPVAALKLRAGQTSDAASILEWSADRLAGYKRPARLIFRDSLPRNAAGKLLRRVLREEYSQDENNS